MNQPYNNKEQEAPQSYAQQLENIRNAYHEEPSAAINYPGIIGRITGSAPMYHRDLNVRNSQMSLISLKLLEKDLPKLSGTGKYPNIVINPNSYPKRMKKIEMPIFRKSKL